MSLIGRLMCLGLVTGAAWLALLWICIRLFEGIQRLWHRPTRKRSRRLRDHPLFQDPPEVDRRKEFLWRPDLYD